MKSWQSGKVLTEWKRESRNLIFEREIGKTQENVGLISVSVKIRKWILLESMLRHGSNKEVISESQQSQGAQACLRVSPSLCKHLCYL